MPNDTPTDHDDTCLDEADALRRRINDLTDRIHTLIMDRGAAVQERNHAMYTLHRKGASIEELAELTGIHHDDVADFVHRAPPLDGPMMS
ncbi:hypothetical protein AS188_10285 [Kocuria flava]|uniref:ANTAR domain-containing protein n=1 Tax=Kocuria flava TaxID=446860 RepID=A0A0U2YX47_9MICC|nr:hypothetical protein [Kocuria flava]ALU40065.1 hypothetical protein AS188_10285 [Kocuria flava]GEO91507.1 hypothetical protein KFL01_08130 [Kocuria flava]